VTEFVASIFVETSADLRLYVCMCARARPVYRSTTALPERRYEPHRILQITKIYI